MVPAYTDSVYSVLQEDSHMEPPRAELTINFLAQGGNFLQAAPV